MSYVGLTRDIPKDGWKAFDDYDCVVELCRGVAKFAKNVCPHRGFRVAKGCGVGKITCPYHGLPFRPKSQQGIVLGEMIFYPGFVPEFDFYLESIGSDLGEEFGNYSFEVNAPYWMWIQNTADPNHLATVHPGSFNDMFASHLPHEVNIGENISSYRLPIKPSVIKRYKRYIPNDTLFGTDFFHMIVFPGASLTSFLGVFYSIETAFPINSDRCRIFTRFFVSRKSEVPQLLLKTALLNNWTLLQEDKAVMERWAENLEEEVTQWGITLPGEERIKWYMKKIGRLHARLY